MVQFDPHPPLSVMLSKNSTLGPVNRLALHLYTSRPDADYMMLKENTVVVIQYPLIYLPDKPRLHHNLLH